MVIPAPVPVWLAKNVVFGCASVMVRVCPCPMKSPGWLNSTSALLPAGTGCCVPSRSAIDPSAPALPSTAMK